MDFRNEMRRDPYARGANGRYSPTFAPMTQGVFSGNGGRAGAEGKCAVPCKGGIGDMAQNAINTLPLAMVYVPEQRFEGIKDPACALEAGTIFDALDLVFTGCRKGGRRWAIINTTRSGPCRVLRSR